MDCTDDGHELWSAEHPVPRVRSIIRSS